MDIDIDVDVSAASSSILSDKFEEYNVQLQAAILNPTKQAFSLPMDLAFHKSVDRDFAREIKICSDKALSITNRLLALAATGNAGGKGKARLLENQEDVIDNFHSKIVDAMDQLLERTDICLDEFLGRSKPPATVVKPQPALKASKTKTNFSQGRLDPALQHASHLPKPQLKFKKKPINDRDSVWQPTLKHKYNAQVPLSYNLYDDTYTPPSSIPHPYRYEISHLAYPPRLFQSIPPVQPKSFEDTPFHWIDTASEFQVMLSKLRQAPEIAVDLEHHNYRSFGGFLCLMQISTRTEDFIVDTLCLREELEELNEVFTDPNIIKVFHGAESDILWLQQDFNIYVVNLFDTFHASKVLDFPRHGLATLLEMYCDFTPDKRFQLADWRIRPLPNEMLSYARSDTHFLLYIYDNLRNALLDRARPGSQSPPQSASGSSSISVDPSHALVHEVLSRSRETSLRLYAQEVYDAEGGSGPAGWDNLAKKWNKYVLMTNANPVNSLAKEVYKCIHEWRDMIAREEDESTRYVLPNHYLFRLADQPPADLPGLLNIFSSSVPPVMKRRSGDLLDKIRDIVAKHLGPRDVQDKVSHIPVANVVASTIELAGEDSVTESTQDDSSIWMGPISLSTVASSSVLFGSSTSWDSYVTQRSSLFGIQSPTVNVPSGNYNGVQSQFEQIRQRIHKALVIAPSVPKVTSSPPAVNGDTQDDLTAEPSVNDTVGIPFVPAPERRHVETVDDSIVVVGQQTRRQKKRKRAGVRVPETAVGGEEEEEIELFDFASTSNVLDANPRQHAEVVSKKKQKQKGGGIQYGNFPAPPKANNQPRTGNQSHTFR